MTSTFSYVYVPADVSQPIEERTHTGPSELGQCTFIECLKGHFAKNATVDTAKFKETMAASHAEAAKHLEKADEDTIQKLAQMTTVDIFTALLGKADNQFEQVSIYVDDKGVSKNLPINMRVTSLMNTAGYLQNQFLGDAFIARVRDDQNDIWQREDFKVEEMRSDAAWIAKVQHQQKNKPSQSQVDDFKKLAGMNVATQQQVAQKPERPSGSTESFSWRDVDDEEFEIKFTKMVGSKKDVKVKFARNSLQVELLGEIVLSGKLFAPVEVDECTWTLSSSGNLEITLMKSDGSTWTELLKE